MGVQESRIDRRQMVADATSPLSAEQARNGDQRWLDPLVSEGGARFRFDQQWATETSTPAPPGPDRRYSARSVSAWPQLSKWIENVDTQSVAIGHQVRTSVSCGFDASSVNSSRTSGALPTSFSLRNLNVSGAVLSRTAT